MDCLNEPPPPYGADDAAIAHVALPDGRCSLGFESCTEYWIRYFQVCEKFVTWTKGSIADEAVCDLDEAELATLQLMLMPPGGSFKNLISATTQYRYCYLRFKDTMKNLVSDSGKIIEF
jgi:hypothetical protein